MKKLIIPILGLLVSACSGKTQTPEEVVEKFASLMAAGECDSALQIATGDAIDQIYGSKDVGCPSFEIKILEINCEITSDTAECCCFEKREGGFREWYTAYRLIKIDGEWKISAELSTSFLFGPDCYELYD